MTRPALRVDAVLIQAIIAGALSFAHLHDLAAAAGQDGWKAWAYPVSVDLLLVAAWRRLRTDGPSRLAWCWFLIALVASLGANVATAGLLDLDDVPAWLRILVAAWPALAFMGGTLLAHSSAGHTSASPDAAPVPDPVPEVEPEPAAAEPAPEPVAAVDDTPALPAADPDPAPPAVPVPAALVDHARKVAADHEQRTGARIDTDTLRARLGVPPHLADAIAAQLT
ncbi:SpdA protein [Streptomyces pseudogriseolus]|nr:SpdA protein [Streptomyces gancidicus]GHF12477.1 SpdA protein [Streptomyces werraensis]